MEKLSEGEWKLMELLWEDAPVNSTQLVARCKETLQWSKSTTYTVLRRLCHKGAAANEEATVTPLVTREDYLAAQSRSFIQKLCGGSLSTFASALCDSGLSKEELEELRELLKEGD